MAYGRPFKYLQLFNGDIWLLCLNLDVELNSVKKEFQVDFEKDINWFYYEHKRRKTSGFLEMAQLHIMSVIVINLPICSSSL
jgi:hypothetical protein